MKPRHFLQIALNFSAVSLLFLLLAAPFYFANIVSKPANIAGAKMAQPYVIVSQIEKFPNMKLSQEGNTYKITFEKVAPSQAFTSIFLVTNPTDKAQTYQISVKNSAATVFFGEDISNVQAKLTLPGLSSVPLSLLSPASDSTPIQTVEFNLIAE